MAEIPETRYATTEDGVSIAYQVLGEGPVDLVLELENWGNVDIMWELPELADLLERLASFSRLVIHDWRGTGLSGSRGSFPNLETRVRDLLTVLDSIRSSRAALLGERTAGAALALLAATHPGRVSSLVWVGGVATRRWSPEYPWGRSPTEIRREAEGVRDGMGTKALARGYLQAAAPDRAGDERLEAQIARHDRQWMAPSTAFDWIVVEGETDVTSVLPLVRCPTLVVDIEGSPTGAAESRHVQAMIAGAQLALVPGATRDMVLGDRPVMSDTIREFLTAEQPRAVPQTVLSTVLFTDIVGSTERQASAGDHAWADIVGRHHAVVREALSLWGGMEMDTAGDGFYATFDGPARALRCALEIVRRVRDLGIEVRAGVHTGECEIIDGKHAGLAVAIGARIAAMAEPSEVLASRTVRDLTAGSGFSFEDRGEHNLKGVPEHWRLYRVS